MKKTSIYDYHVKHGGKIVEFCSWALPVQFSGLIKEHLEVRTNAGIFDVSHMGEILIEGEDAKTFVDYLLTNDATKLYPGRVFYTAMCYPDGGIIDDLLVYMYNDNKFLLVVNASNIEKDFNYIIENNKFNCKATNVSQDYFQLAVQGPSAEKFLNKLLNEDLNSIKFFHFKELLIENNNCIVSRTGYTGEDGFEIYGPWAYGGILFDKLVKIGVAPCGLGARDTLRLEAALMLYGNDIDKTTSPLEAGIDFCVKLNKKSDFIGKDALIKQKEKGLNKKLYGFTLDNGIARNGYEIFDINGKKVGFVTSGTMSPSLDKAVFMAYIDTSSDLNNLFVKIRKNLIKINNKALPFVNKATKI